MFEIGFVGGTGRQQGDPVIGVLSLLLQRVAESTEKRGETVDMGFRIDIGKRASGRHPVFESKTGAGRCLRAVSQYPPVAVRSAADLEGTEMQIVAGCRFHADHGP